MTFRLPTDPEVFRNLVIADARNDPLSDYEDAQQARQKGDLDDHGFALAQERYVEAKARYDEAAQALRAPDTVARWRETLVTVLRELDVQYASNNRQATLAKLELARQRKLFLAGKLTEVDYAGAKIAYLEAGLKQDEWRSKVAKFRAGMEARLREARTIQGHYSDGNRLRDAIEEHQRVTLEDYEPTDADYKLWSALQ